MAFIDVVGKWLAGHWLEFLLPVLGIVAGALWGRWRARRAWQRKEFLHRLNVSLNSIRDGTLRIRTVLEKDLLAVLLNQVATRKVLEAAARTTETDPLLPLARDDAWYLLNAILNEVSERFAVGVLRRDLGVEVRSARYLLCLTNEVAGDVRTHKVRAMLVRRETLEGLPPEMPELESPNHETRWHTLKRMAAAWKTEKHNFLELEIAP